MDVARERGLSFLYRLRRQAEDFPENRTPDVLPERDGRVAGALGAYEVTGLLSTEEVDAWRVELLAPTAARPALSTEVRECAAELLGELLAVVPRSDEELAPELERFEGAFAALARVGAVGEEWDRRMRDWLGRPSAEEEDAMVRELNAGGTEQELVAVLPGPSVAVDGVRVLYGLRFTDGVSFTLQREQPLGDLGDHEFWDFDLRDDVGTEYSLTSGGGSDFEQHVTFRTAPPADASWLELAPTGGTPIRIAL